VREAGAEPAIADGLDAAAVAQAVKRAKPEVLIHELTAIPADFDLRKFEDQFRLTNRLRTEGTDHLLAAAHATGVRRFIGQSYCGWTYARTGGPVKTEEDPLEPNPPRALRNTLAAIRYLESAVLQASGLDGIVLRYGSFYGPGNAIGENGAVVEQVRHRKVPVIGGGTAVWSFIHIDDAARATAAAVERGAPGIYNITDDEPAAVSEWLPELARVLRAKPPLRLPAWLGRLAIGEHGLMMMTETRGALNAKAKRELGWQLQWPTWRYGFRSGLSAGAPSVLTSRAPAGSIV
jgi:nucleoside-diphosphate-sugar epimerase